MWLQSPEIRNQVGKLLVIIDLAETRHHTAAVPNDVTYPFIVGGGSTGQILLLVNAF